MAAEEEKTEGLPKICAYCGKKALYACACGKRYYSSQKCQKQDWRERHKIECTDEIAVNMPLSAELWAALHSLYHSSAESKKFEVVRYAHTRRPMVRYGWYPPAVISPVPSGRKIRKKPALQLLRQPRPVIFPEQGHSYMPVCRYEEFTHQARLIPGEPSEYCGRFFFYEPNSATLLDLKSCACFPTKVAAFYALKHLLTDDELAAEVKNPMCRVNFRDDYDALYDMLPQRSFSAETFLRQFYQWFPRKFVADQVPTFFVDGGRITRLVPAAEINSGLIPWDSSAALITPLSPSYGKNYKRMSPVGTNDRFDQIICRAARRAGIDTIVLLFEQGDSRAATEILCTDEDPYKRLAWRAKDVAEEARIASNPEATLSRRLATKEQIVPERFRFLASDPQLATVWFLEDGLMYFDGRTLVPRTPIVLDDGKFEGFEDASPLPPRNPPWTSKYEFNWRGK